MLTKRQFLSGTAGCFTIAALSGTASAQTVQGPTPDDVYRDPGNPVLGNPHGDVSIAEFFDFQCPYCKKDFPTVRKVAKEDGKVRIVMKDWPIFGPPSPYASHLALAAHTIGKYDAALDGLMATRAKLSKAEVQAALTGAGLDIDELERTYAAHKKTIDAVIDRNTGIANAFAFRGTPSYVIGRSIYFGVLSENDLKAAISKARR